MYRLILTIEPAHSSELSSWQLRLERAGYVRLTQGHFTIPYAGENPLIKLYLERAFALHPGKREISFELGSEDIEHTEALLSEVASFTPLSETASTAGSEPVAAAGAGRVETGGGGETPRPLAPLLAAGPSLFAGSPGYATPTAAGAGSDELAFTTPPDSALSLSDRRLYALGLTEASESTGGGSRLPRESGGR